MPVRTMRALTLLSRAVLSLSLAVSVVGCSVVGALAGCQPIAPSQLPSGAAPGAAVEGVSAGTKQFVWGTGRDRVEQLLEIEFTGAQLPNATVRGHDATVFRMPSHDEWDLAFSWSESDCHYTVFLAPGTSTDEAMDYAGRY